jgi:glycosyltransferase involved in cell wall biosynthesis
VATPAETAAELRSPHASGGRQGRRGSHTRLKIAVVLWNGDLGGAEAVSTEVIRQWANDGIDGSVVFVQDSFPLAARLAELGIRFSTLDFQRGGGVVRHLRRFAKVVAGLGRDGALVLDCGYLAALLRLGGYRGPIVGVEHGGALTFRDLPRQRQWRRRLERALGARARSIDFAVSEFMLSWLRAYPHARHSRRLYNGVDLRRFAPRSVTDSNCSTDRLVIGSAGRLIAGKGFDHLIRAVATLQPQSSPVLRVAGDGPERTRLEAVAASVGLADQVEFLGPIDDMPSFWNACDIAVVPSAAFVESFSMTTLEAMACGRPVVATLNGGIPEVLADAGTLIPVGNVQALAAAISRYLENPALRAEHGRRARLRAEREFDIAHTARVLAACFRRVAEP